MISIKTKEIRYLSESLSSLFSTVQGTKSKQVHFILNVPKPTFYVSLGVSDEEDDDIADSPQASNPSPQAKGRGGSHIHLWQFLKELLANPQANGACIRWLDRTNGVFKIEDSVRVARLWGKRKNRPAMNYDKLSRSIRQYYKKGIMKKTERSQRLVYQFCHPYSL